MCLSSLRSASCLNCSCPHMTCSQTSTKYCFKAHIHALDWNVACTHHLLISKSESTSNRAQWNNWMHGEGYLCFVPLKGLQTPGYSTSDFLCRVLGVPWLNLGPFSWARPFLLCTWASQMPMATPATMLLTPVLFVYSCSRAACLLVAQWWKKWRLLQMW